MSDEAWQVAEPVLPAPARKTGRGGRPAGHCCRDIADAIRYLVKEGIQWRAMPADFPPYQTVYDVLHGWHRSGATEQMHDGLRVKDRSESEDLARDHLIGLAGRSRRLPVAARSLRYMKFQRSSV